MSFLGNLMGGLSAAAGSQYGVDVAEKNKQRRELMSDQVLQFQTDRILGDVKQAQARLGDPNITPEDRKHWEDRLQSFQQAFVDLYHPEKNPGALSKLGGYLRKHVPGVSHIPGMRAPAAPATPAAAKKSLAELESGLWAAPSMDDNLTKLNNWARDFERVNGRPPNADEKKDAFNHIAMGSPFERKSKGTWKQYQSPDQKAFQWFDVSDPDSIPEGWTAVPTKTAGGGALKVGSFGEFLTNAYGPHPTPEQEQEGRRLWAEAGAGTSVGEHMILVPQPDGTTVPFIVQTTTRKVFGSDQPAAAAPTPAPAAGETPAPTQKVPTTPAEAKKNLPHAGYRQAGPAIGGKRMPEVTAALETADKLETDARTVSSYMKERAKGNKSPTGDTSIVIAWVRAQVRGAGRMTNVEIEQALRSGSWGTRFSNAFNRALEGTLDDQFVNNMVTDINRGAQAARATADKYKRRESGQPAAKTHVSMKKAMALPQNIELVKKIGKAKAEAEVRRGIVKEKLIPIEDLDSDAAEQ